MKQWQIEILKNELNLELTPDTISKLSLWQELFLKYNEHTNLTSKKDAEQLFEKHVFDSLALLKCPCFVPQKGLRALDIGTGGGFPSVILAIVFPEAHIIAVDSVGKKINFLNIVKKELKLNNLEPTLTRVENLPPQKVDFILSRAVARIKEIISLSKKHFSPSTKYLLHKAKTADEEIAELNLKIAPEIFRYTLPSAEKHSRCLILIDKL